jgi:hypothetical protein
MRAIEWTLNVQKLIDIRYGESEFKVIQEFWYEWSPDGGEKTTAFKPNLVPDTPTNRQIIDTIANDYIERKRINDEFDKNLYVKMNKLERIKK